MFELSAVGYPLVAGLSFVLMVWALSRFLPLPLAAVLAAIRLAIPLLYFEGFLGPSWRLRDDESYFESGASLVRAQHHPVDLLWDDQDRSRLMAYAGGHHFFYLYWNYLVMWFFGVAYETVVVFNQFLSGLVALFLFRWAVFCGYSEKFSRTLGVFSLFQWDFLLWFSLFNLKDSVVCAFVAAMLWWGSRLAQGLHWPSVVGVAVSSWLFWYLRFYVPVVFAISYLGWQLLYGTRWWRLLSVLGAGGVGLAVVGLLGSYLSQDEARSSPAGMVANLIKLVLTPLPWSIDESYEFLALNAWLNLAFLPLAALGAFKLWGDGRLQRFALFFLLAGLLLLSLTPELSGPRQRLTVTVLLVITQFRGLWALLEVVRLAEAPQGLTGLPSDEGPALALSPQAGA